MNWTLHFLEAEASLSPWRDRLTQEARAAHDRIADVLSPDTPMPRVDILLQRTPMGCIPDFGMGGHAYSPHCLSVTLDPDNPAYATSLDAGEFGRTLAHELYHCLRFAASGYEHSMGSSLVSEGLCDQFDREVNGGDGRPWSHALSPQQWPTILAQIEPLLTSRDYDHAAWFFGRNYSFDTIPRWTGYTVGYHLVGAYLDAHPDVRPSRLSGIPAADLLAEAWPLLRASKTVAAA